MAYINDRFPYPIPEQQPMIYYQHPPELIHHYQPQPQPHQLDTYYPGYAPVEYSDFGGHLGMPDEFDEVGEVSTRPRLTKEQVEVLESQFQAHPKPNSIVKRQLASQTKLTLPRVANWFQNRRAKAKQQRKQEEFEITQQLGLSTAWKSDDNLAQFSSTRHENTTINQQSPHSPADALHDNRPASVPLSQHPDPAKKASWASLQRAITAAEAARTQEPQIPEGTTTTMPPPDLPRQPSHQPHSAPMVPNAGQHSSSSFAEWADNTDSGQEWTTAALPNSIPFDFGFDQIQHASICSEVDPLDSSPHHMPAQTYAPQSDPWSQPLQTPTFPRHPVAGLGSIDLSPAVHHPSYPNSRRGSTADDLTATFGNFGMEGTPPTHAPMPALQGLEQNRRFEGEIDLAARRKRPRPAALGSASLRSRSYGALTSMSPTFRTGSALANPHPIRHVKSTGHSLNARFAGVRKPSSAQRSPLNVSSFAEAEAFHQLMARQAVNAQFQQDPTRSGTTTPYLSPEMIGNNQLPIDDQESAVGQMQEYKHQFPIHNIQQLHPSMTSPPTTPFQPDYIFQTQMQSMMPPASAPPQYATFPDYTPPYSAGPLTSSSWSDAPLTSPEMPSFPSLTHIPSLAFSQQGDLAISQFQHYMMPPDSRTEINVTGNSEAKPTEFFILEFPGQKEEHAHVAQQLPQQHPKSYTFANITPNDFDG